MSLGNGTPPRSVGSELGGQQAANQQVSNQQRPFTFERSFWFSLFSLLAGEPIPTPPRTVGGRIVTVFLMFMGMTIFAMFYWNCVGVYGRTLRTEGRFVDWEQLENHVIVCGWNRKAEIIVQEFRNSPDHADVPIVVISDFDGPLPQPSVRRIYF